MKVFGKVVTERMKALAIAVAVLLAAISGVLIWMPKGTARAVIAALLALFLAVASLFLATEYVNAPVCVDNEVLTADGDTVTVQIEK